MTSHLSKYREKQHVNELLNRHSDSGSFMVDTGILFSNMKCLSHECQMTFWPLTNSDFPTNQTFHQFHDLDTDFDLHRITSGFHGAFAMGVACQQGTLTLPDTWFRPPFWDLLLLQLLRPNSSNLPCLYSIFHLEYPLVLSRFCLWSIQMRFSRFGLFKRTSSKCIPSGLIHAKETSFSTKRKVVKYN